MSWGIAFRARQYVKSSLWLAPFVGGLAGILLAEAGLWLDTQGIDLFWSYSPETAIAVVSSTIGAVASLIGFVVTVTVLGVQMATGNFSARYMRIWYRDGLLKLVLAELTGTLLFAFLVIRQISAVSVPDVSVTVAGFGVSVGVLLFVLYLDRFLHRMRPVAVADLVAREARRTFDAWVREARRPTPPSSAVARRGLRRRRLRRSRHPFGNDPGGRHGRAHPLCTAPRVSARLPAQHRRLRPDGLRDRRCHGEGVSPAAAQQLSGLIALGVERTIEQDPAFAIRVMVDVATRALSPAVNDPTTAVQVLDHIGEALRTIGAYSAPSMTAAMSESSAPGVVMQIRSWPDFLTLAITEIREYGATSIQVTRRLRALLEELRDWSCPRTGRPWTTSCAGSTRPSASGPGTSSTWTLLALQIRRASEARMETRGRSVRRRGSRLTRAQMIPSSPIPTSFAPMTMNRTVMTAPSWTVSQARQLSSVRRAPSPPTSV